MPHECTNCGRTFPDGSKQMLSGCPDCGGNKFQFAPNGTAAQESSTRSGGSERNDPPQSPPTESPTDDSGGVASRAAETVRGWVSSDSTDATGADSDHRSRDVTGSNVDATGSSAGVDESVSGGAADSKSDRSSDGARDASRASESRSIDTSEFTEWPETARRPEDRPSGDGIERRTPSSSSNPQTDRTGDRSTDEPTLEQTPDRDADSAASTESTSIADEFADEEDTAQADARSEVVSRSDLPSEPAPGDENGRAPPPADQPPTADGDAPPDHGRVVSEPSTEQPSIEDLREELNQQFESIKIVSPGQYELNLMELYNREEYIISLQEDGRYVIDVPDSWRGDDTE